jgi:excinuclease ABC subunit A
VESGKAKPKSGDSPFAFPISLFPSHTARTLAPYLNGAETSSVAKREKRKAVPPVTHITVRGASQHNLRSIDVDVPRDEMTVCCGPSGSGKTSLAMDTIYAEGQRRFVESLSSYARQFVGQLEKPAFEHIEGLSPAIAIEQRTAGHTPRSSVGTVTEIYDYFRILVSRLGQMFCPECDIPVGTQSPDEIIDAVLAEPDGTKAYVCAPLELAQGAQYEQLWEKLRGEGYQRVRVDGVTYEIGAVPTIDRRRHHDVEVIVDRVTIRKDARSRLADSIETALSLGRGVLNLVVVLEGQTEDRWPTKVHSQHLVCSKCGRSFEPLSRWAPTPRPCSAACR